MVNQPKTYVFSDIHGCATELKLLLNKLPLEKNSRLIFLGDYVDRGANSKEVIETILELKKHYEVIALKGNHEDLFLSFIDDPGSYMAGNFIFNGGGATLASYGNEFGETHIPDSHIQFLKELPIFFEDDDYFFVHAGVPDIPLSEVKLGGYENQLLWIRDPFLSSQYQWEKTIVHGHTPAKEVELLPNRINIDTGCVYFNKLSALELPSKRVYSVAINTKIEQAVLRDQRSKRRSVRFAGSIPIYIFGQNGQVLEFETINYSVFGMYIRDIINSNKQVLSTNQIVRGEIGRHNQDTIQFEGEVLRCDIVNDTVCYAINMTKTPYDFLSDPWGISSGG